MRASEAEEQGATEQGATENGAVEPGARPSLGGRAGGTVRDARAAVLLVFAANGLLLVTWMSRLPEVKSMLGLTPGQLGMLLLAISAGALTGLPLAGRLLQRLGPVRVVRLGLVLALLGMVSAATAVTAGWPLPVAMSGLYLVGFGSGIWDVAQNLEGTKVEQALGRSIMPWFHAAFSGGTVAGALLAFGLIHAGVPLLVHVVAVTCVCAIAVSWGTSRFLPTVELAEGAVASSVGSSSVRAEAKAQRSAWLEPRTLLLGVMVLAAAFAEGTANDWMAVAFVDGHGVSQAEGVLALAVFLACMTAGRILGTSALDRYGRVPVLAALFGCALLGSMLVVFGSTLLAFVGAAVWGLGASLGFPVGMSAAADDPRRAAVRLSVVATIGYGAFLAGPAVIGFLGDHVGVLRALAVVGLVSALALGVVPAARPLATTSPDGTAP